MSRTVHQTAGAPPPPEWFSDAHSPWRAILESVHDYVLTVDRDGRILFVNRVQAAVTADDLLGRSVFDLAPAEQVARGREALARVFATGEPSPELECAGPGPEGKPAWYRAWIAPLREGGAVAAAVIVVRDISRRRRAELALEQAEADYRALVERAVEGVFRTAPDGRILMANQALARMLGYECPEDLIACRPNVEQGHYVRPEERARLKRLLEAHGLVRGFEYEVYRRDGTTVWLRDHVRVARDAGGGILHYEGTVEDVTNRRRAEALLDLRARQQAAVARLGEAAVAGGDLGDLLDCAAALVANTLGVRYSQVLELRADGDLVMRAGDGWPATAEGDDAAGRDPQAAFTLHSARPVVVENLPAETRFPPPAHLLARGVVSGLSVIIGAPEQPYGVLSAHTTERRAFTAADVDFLQGTASLLGAAIARRRAEDVRQHLLARAISAQEEERRRVARELHDETGQALSAILVGLRSLDDSTTIGEARTVARQLRELAADTVRDVGRLARGLRPTTLDDLGLVPALRRYAEELGAARQLAVHLADEGIDRLPPEVETTLYRIVQEALTNVARHARARTAAVILKRLTGVVQAIVQDDGRGFDVAAALHPAARRQALGLVGMQERAALVAGSVVITSRAGEGTTVDITLPLR